MSGSQPDIKELDRPLGLSLIICAALALLCSLAFALANGEFVTHFHAACLHRYTDIAGYVYHQVNGTQDRIHPAYGLYARHCMNLPVLLARGLVRAGWSVPWAVNITVLIMRTTFGVGISWLALAATRRRAIGVLAVLLAAVLPQNATIYGHLFHQPLTGYFTTSLFLTACALCMAGRPRLSMFCWGLQALTHPTTFVCWTPVYVGLFVLSTSWLRARLAKWNRLYLAMMVAGPTIIALLAGLAERTGWLPWAGGRDYWALVRVKANHSVFLFYSASALPLQYFSQVAALFLLAYSRRSQASRLEPLQGLCAFAGLGIGLMYLFTVETEFSIIANMCLPLRFECVMYPLIMVSVLEIVFRPDPRLAAEGLLAAVYGVTLFFPSLRPITWAWAWATGNAWLGTSSKTRGYLFGCLAGVCVTLGYLIFGPSGQSSRANLGTAAVVLPALGILLAGGLICRYARAPRLGLKYTAACILILLIAPRTWPTSFGALGRELHAIAYRLPEQSPEKQACDWLARRVPANSPVLVENNLFLHLACPINTSLNRDLIEWFLYAPRFAPEMVAQMRELYGLDLPVMAARGERIAIVKEDWLACRARFLGPEPPASPVFEYVVEPARYPCAAGCSPAFNNDFVRVYRVGEAPAAQATAASG